MAAATVSLSNNFSVFIKFYCVPTFELVDNKFTSYLPKNSVYLIEQWVKDLDVDIRVVKPRKSKLGDFRCNLNRKYIISINNNLNQFSFLITLIHELAHAFVYEKYRKTVLAHGNEWKEMFRKLMFNFLSDKIFPHDILSSLSKHLINPSASTCNDVVLSLVLRRYDLVKSLNISEIKQGEKFIFSDRTFIKGEKLRKRFKCIDLKTNKLYLFNPLAKIDLPKGS